MKKYFLFFLFLIVGSCGSLFEGEYTGYEKAKGEPGLFSKDREKGINLSDFLMRQEDSGEAFYVNSFLWRASLEVVSIAPLISTDAFGGTILTDWYEDPKIKNKRIKLAVFIKSRELRSDGLSVKVYIQAINDNKWSKITHDKNLSSKVEEVILSKARDLRIKTKLK
tara:strand:- start:237 stop:737 length:501 start_codon:yes stop_codon:yes gene_type:complete